MRRLMKHGRETGVSTVFFALLAPALVGAVGLGVDTGNMTLQKSGVQRAADAAAMAIGQDCAQATRVGATTAQKNRCTQAGATATAQLMINGNASGAVPTVSAALAPGQGNTTVTVTKSVTMIFAKAVGVTTKTARATASVTWSQVPTAATTFPLGMSYCDYLNKKGSKTAPELYRYDFYQSGRSDTGDNAAVQCGTKYSLKGALWIIDGTAWIPNSSCRVATSIGLSGWIAASNTFFPPSCTERARALVAGKTYLLPVFDTPAATKYTNRFLPTIRGFAPFVITGWRMGGFLGIFDIVTGGTNTPVCSQSVLFVNVCRGVQGYFTGSIIPLDEVDSYGVNSVGDFGSVRVKLTS